MFAKLLVRDASIVGASVLAWPRGCCCGSRNDVVMFLALLGIVLDFPLVVYSLVAGRVPPVDGVQDRKPAQRVGA